MYICIYKAYFRLVLPYNPLYIAYIREFSGNMGTKKNKAYSRQQYNNPLSGNCAHYIKLPLTVDA